MCQVLSWAPYTAMNKTAITYLLIKLDLLTQGHKTLFICQNTEEFKYLVYFSMSPASGLTHFKILVIVPSSGVSAVFKAVIVCKKKLLFSSKHYFDLNISSEEDNFMRSAIFHAFRLKYVNVHKQIIFTQYYWAHVNKFCPSKYMCT